MPLVDRDLIQAQHLYEWAAALGARFCPLFKDGAHRVLAQAFILCDLSAILLAGARIDLLGIARRVAHARRASRHAFGRRPPAVHTSKAARPPKA